MTAIPLQGIPNIDTFPPRIAVMEQEPCPAEDTRDKGVRCPQCSCAHVPVMSTRHYGERTKQARECRHCGKKFATWVTLIPED